MMESANFITQETSRPLNARLATTSTVTQLYPRTRLVSHTPFPNPARMGLVGDSPHAAYIAAQRLAAGNRLVRISALSLGAELVGST